ncbi:LPXTG cell wall anchor domain-containing protein, partial [Lactobacillus sp. LC28-10]
DGTVDYQPAFEAQQDLLNQGYTLKKGNNNGLANAKTTYDHGDAATPTYVVVLSKIKNVKVPTTLIPTDDQGNAIPNKPSTTVSDYPGTIVTVPTIPGYTATTDTVTIPANRDDTVNVVYTPNPQSIKVQFVDDKGTDLGAVTLSGVSDANVDYSGAFAKEQELLNQGYTPSKGDNNGLVSASKTFNQYGKTPTYIVELSHVEGVEIDKVPTDNVPFANQYTVNFVTPSGTVVGTTSVVGNPGNNFNVAGNVPNGYQLVNTGEGIVKIPNDQNPAQPINVMVVVPVGPSGGGSTDVTPDNPETDTTTPTDDDDVNTDGADHNTVTPSDSVDNHITAGNPDNNTVATNQGQNATNQSARSNQTSHSDAQSELAYQESRAAVTQSQQTSNSGVAGDKSASLPQTSEQNSSFWALLGLGLMSMLSLLGFTKQKKREDEK